LHFQFRPLSNTRAIALPGLPSELIDQISNNMSYGSRLALKLPCRELLGKTGLPTKRYSMADLLEIEQWPEYNRAKSMPLESKQPSGQRDFFACHLCLKIRSADNFANTIMKSKRGKLGQGTVGERSERFCIQCGVKYGIYRAGTYIHFGGAAQSHGFVCWGCGIFEDIGYCTEAQIVKRRYPVCWSRTSKEQRDPFP
jgi:hypothetical protein